MLFQTVQTVYWLALSTWFGSVMFIMLAAPVILRTVRENNPILSHVLSVNLDGQHSTLLGGTIVLNLVSRLLQIQIVCAGLLLLTLVVQPLIIDLRGSNMGAAVIRSVMYLVAVAVVYYDWRFVWTKIRSNHAEYVDHADEPEVANPALDRLDREQRKSLTLLGVVVALLLGMILFSSTIGTLAHTTQIIEKAQK